MKILSAYRDVVSDGKWLVASLAVLASFAMSDTASATHPVINSCAQAVVPQVLVTATDIVLVQGDRIRVTPSHTANVMPHITGVITPIATATTFTVGAGQAGNWMITPTGAPGATATVQCILGDSQADSGSAADEFVANRAQNILNNMSDLSKRVGPDTSSLSGGGSSASGYLVFNSSLSAANAAANKRIDNAFPIAQDGSFVSVERSLFDIWMAGSFNWSKIGDVKSSVGLLSLGADYRISPDLVVGVMGQLDLTDDDGSSISNAGSGEGTGWLVGPYLVTRLSDALVFDAQIAAGQSHNETSPDGTYTDKFDTNRFLIKGQLTGTYKLQDYVINPILKAAYFIEQREAFTNGKGDAISAKNLNFGRVTFGPRVSRSFTTDKGWQVNPFAALSGTYSFGNGLPSQHDANKLSARIESGVGIVTSDGTTFMLEGNYDGIGVNNYDSVGGKLKIAIPLN